MQRANAYLGQGRSIALRGYLGVFSIGMMQLAERNDWKRASRRSLPWALEYNAAPAGAG